MCAASTNSVGEGDGGGMGVVLNLCLSSVSDRLV